MRCPRTEPAEGLGLCRSSADAGQPQRGQADIGNKPRCEWWLSIVRGLEVIFIFFMFYLFFTFYVVSMITLLIKNVEIFFQECQEGKFLVSKIILRKNRNSNIF